MPLSLLRWSIAILFMCLLAPVAFAGEEARKPASRPAKKQRTVKKTGPSKQLVRVPGGERLRGDAAGAFKQMHAAALQDGLWLWVVSGHRSVAEQRWLYRRYRRGQGPRAARPGRSNHQRGTAVDVSVGDESSAAYAWLAANACRYGFKRTVRSEPWHWEYRPRTTAAPLPGHDCLGRPLLPPPAPPEMATPSPS